MSYLLDLEIAKGRKSLIDFIFKWRAVKISYNNDWRWLPAANACIWTNVWCPLRFLGHASAHKKTSSSAWSSAIVVTKLNSYSERAISGRCCLYTVRIECEQRYSNAIPISKLNDELKPVSYEQWIYMETREGTAWSWKTTTTRRMRCVEYFLDMKISSVRQRRLSPI